MNPLGGKIRQLHDRCTRPAADRGHQEHLESRLDESSLGTAYPELQNYKDIIIGVASRLRTKYLWGVAGDALHRACCIGAPVPAGCFSHDDLRAAVVAYHFKKVDRRSVESITLQFGPSLPTLYRHHKRLLANLTQYEGAAPTREEVQRVAAALEFDKAGQRTYFSPAEERLLVKEVEKHGHTPGDGKLRFVKRVASATSEEAETPEKKQRLASAGLGYTYLADMRARVEARDAADEDEAGTERLKEVLLALGEERAAPPVVAQVVAIV